MGTPETLCSQILFPSPVHCSLSPSSPPFQEFLFFGPSCLLVWGYICPAQGVCCSRMILASVLLHLASLGPAEPAVLLSRARAERSIYDESPSGPGVDANVAEGGQVGGRQGGVGVLWRDMSEGCGRRSQDPAASSPPCFCLSSSSVTSSCSPGNNSRSSSPGSGLQANSPTASQNNSKAAVSSSSFNSSG